jgi:DNA-binding response OmpR family regulator
MTSGKRAGRTILVAEGHDIVRRYLIRALVRNGYDAQGEALGMNGLSALSLEPDRYALLVTSIDLPDIGGEELARRSRAIAPWLRVLFMVGGRGRSPDSMGRALAKPFTHAAFLSAVAGVLSGP